MIENGRTMLPIANIARALGLKDGQDIKWDEAKQEVTIRKRDTKLNKIGVGNHAYFIVKNSLH